MRATKLLISFCEEKKIINEDRLPKNVWQLAAKELEKAAVRVSPENCKTKMQNLKAQYKVQRLKNEKSGAGKMNWPYFDDMDIFMGNNPKVAPFFWPAVAIQ